MRGMSICCHLANRLALPVKILVPNQWALFHRTCRVTKVDVNKVNIFLRYRINSWLQVVPFDVNCHYIDNA